MGLESEKYLDLKHDYGLAFSHANNYQLIQEFAAHKRTHELAGPEFDALTDEMVRRYKGDVTMTAKTDLALLRVSEIRGIPKNSKTMWKVKKVINDSFGYTTLWAGSIENNGVKYGVKESLDEIKAGNIKEFYRKSINRAEENLKYLRTR